MEKNKNKKKKRKTEKLIFGIGITSLILIVATYAWFIGLTEVTVNSFEINVQSSEGLTLSLNGVEFNDTVNITENGIKGITEEGDDTTTAIAKASLAYSGNTNHWVGDTGLVPLSTVGNINAATSTLELYSKTSIKSLTGGYKLRADKLTNIKNTGTSDAPVYEADEQDGYVVFDLFIKNSAGSGYTNKFAEGDDEGIYMTADSIVQMVASGVAVDGEDEGGDGIENSVRVAFMQIGRVDAKTGSPTTIQCYTGELSDGEQTSYDNGTGLCNQGSTNNGQGITWNIWEPNDTRHNTDSVTHFTKICRARTAADTYGPNACLPDDTTPTTSTFADNLYVDTYAVNSNITSADNVNIYDGINGYESISTKLTKMTYFTDTIKAQADRQEIFFLAPNSITKVRVYVYLEGQDVDNYDLGTIGKKVQVSFGFTKDKYNQEEPELEPEP